MATTALTRHIALAAAAWAGIVLGAGPELSVVQRVILLGMLVVTPLGLARIRSRTPGAAGRWLAWCQVVWPMAAMAGALSLLLQEGTGAVALAAVWAVFTMALAVAAVPRFLRRRRHSVMDLAVDAALLQLPVGGVWLTLQRTGWPEILGFTNVIAELTATHFHFAGWAAPLIAAGVIEKSRSRVGLRLSRLVASLLLLGTPLTAIGITTHTHLESVGAFMVITGMTGVALLLIVEVAPSIRDTLAAVLVRVAAMAALAAMALASMYAAGGVHGQTLISIPNMVLWHGSLGGLGFSTLALVAFALMDRESVAVESPAARHVTEGSR